MPVIINGTTGISGVDGSAGTPAFQGSDANTGIRFGTDIVSLVTGGSDRLYIDSSGRLGVGTSSPSDLLSLSGTGTILGFASGPVVSLVDTSGRTLKIAGPGAVTNAVVGTTTNHDFQFITGNTVRATFDTSGRLGIGTTSPSELLHLSKSSGSTYILQTNGTATTYLGPDSSNTGLWGTSTNHDIRFMNNNTERVRIDTSGRMLVGTSTARSNVRFTTDNKTPTIQFETAQNEYVGLSVINNSNAGYPANVWIGSANGTSVGSNGLVGNQTIGNINFVGADGTNLIHAARIHVDTDGTTGSGDMPARLVFSTTVDGGSSPVEHLRINNIGETKCFSNNNSSTIELRNGSSSGTANRLLYGLHSATDNNTGTAIYSIFTNGTTGTPSDIRLKKNVESARSGYLADINDLRVVKYHWKTQDDAEPKELGLIAQEVEEVFPGLIHTEGEGDNEIKEIKRSVIPFILLKALQEADAKIEAQQVVINDLLARVAALESA